MQVDYFQTLLSYLDPSIKKVSCSFVKRKLIPYQAELLELRVKDHLKSFGAVVLTYDLWMSQKNEEIFSMTSHRCEVLEHGLLHIGMLYTTSTDGRSLTNVVNVLVKIGL